MKTVLIQIYFIILNSLTYASEPLCASAFESHPNNVVSISTRLSVETEESFSAPENVFKRAQDLVKKMTQRLNEETSPLPQLDLLRKQSQEAFRRMNSHSTEGFLQARELFAQLIDLTKSTPPNKIEAIIHNLSRTEQILLRDYYIYQASLYFKKKLSTETDLTKPRLQSLTYNMGRMLEQNRLHPELRLLNAEKVGQLEELREQYLTQIETIENSQQEQIWEIDYEVSINIPFFMGLALTIEKGHPVYDNVRWQ